MGNEMVGIIERGRKRKSRKKGKEEEEMKAGGG